MLRERPLSQLHFAQLIQLATGTRGNRHSSRRGARTCALMVTYFDFSGLDEDSVSMAITMERNEGDLPRQQVLATY